MSRCTPLALVILLSGCTGIVEEPRGTDRAERCEVGPPRFEQGTRLTREEYARTARDLVGVDGAGIVSMFPADDRVGQTGFTAGRTMPAVLVEAQLDAAHTLAQAVVNEIERHLPCDPTVDGERVCAEQFVRSFGRRAWRRSLDDDEVTRAMALYDEGIVDGGFNSGVELAVEGLLTAPWFLYHVEARADDVADAVVERTGFALADRLAYFLWGSMPDDALLDAAEEGRLITAEDAEREARRMLEDERAHEGVSAFFDGWLELERIRGIQRDPTFYPGADAALAASLERSTRAFVEWAYWDAGTLPDLLLSDRIFVDERLAAIYGGEASGETMVAISAPEQRRGLLTQPGLLALHAKDTQSSPILRGVFVRTAILCQDLAPPPMNVNFTVPPPSAGLSTRERFAQHTGEPSCAGCHNLIDPVGFAVERYDAIGAYRETENGVAIDDSGTIASVDALDTDVNGGLELADLIANSREVSDCYVEQWARYAVRRRLTRNESCALEDVRTTFHESGGDLRELTVAIAASPLIRERRVAADVGSVTP